MSHWGHRYAAHRVGQPTVNASPLFFNFGIVKRIATGSPVAPTTARLYRFQQCKIGKWSAPPLSGCVVVQLVAGLHEATNLFIICFIVTRSWGKIFSDKVFDNNKSIQYLFSENAPVQQISTQVTFLSLLAHFSLLKFFIHFLYFVTETPFYR